jgi:hypothetical protein
LTGCYGDKYSVGCEEPACAATEEVADEEAAATTEAQDAETAE